MATTRNIASSIDAYIDAQTLSLARERMARIREIGLEVAPDAQQWISYAIPTLSVPDPEKPSRRKHFYFAAFAKHVSVFPVPREHPDFIEILQAYRGGRGTAQFPHTEPLPENLIERLARHILAR